MKEDTSENNNIIMKEFVKRNASENSNKMMKDISV